MPKSTLKSVLQDEVIRDATMRFAQLDSSDESGEEEVYSTLEEDLFEIESCRFGGMTRVPKQKIWLDEVLPKYDDNRFKQVVRISRANFDKVVNLISGHEIFASSPNQLSVTVQLAIVLYRFGIYGTGASLANISIIFGIGDGSTVVRITRRVITALLSIKDKYVYWPNEYERQEIVNRTQNYLPNCIGWIDGTHIPIEEAPKLDKDSYYNKSKRYSIQLQLICDDEKRIRHFVTGYPGSVHDSRVWNECNLSKNPQRFFSDDQYISGDKGYGLSTLIITPFRENSTQVPQKNLKLFNKYYSSHRVKIEHVNGVLKETFGSLKELRVRIKDEESHKNAVDWISACVVLYNVILPDYSVDEIILDTTVSLDSDNNTDVQQALDDVSGETKRTILYNFVINKLQIR